MTSKSPIEINNIHDSVTDRGSDLYLTDSGYFSQSGDQ